MAKTVKYSTQNIAAFVESFLAPLTAREREVLKSRYGLHGSEPETLQAIGDREGITRERVRQIEAGALSTLKAHRDHPYLASFTETATASLKRFGGVAAEDVFLKDIKRALADRSPEKQFGNAAKFVLELTGKFSGERDNFGDWRPYWYLSEADRKRAQAFVGQLVSALRARKEEVVGEKKFDTVLASVARSAKISEEAAKNYMGLSKQFVVGPFKEMGLAEWTEVNPRTARDWAYAILKREQRPFHFTELAKVIASHRSEKATNLQTIHNELIKDDRFVLVGRGLYGLREFGYIPGTAKEIITHVLRKHGPLPPAKVVSLVKAQRFLKDATILINLQNRKNFQSSPDGRYQVREA